MKAIALISGGLDSMLAAKVVKEQGIDILPLHFKIPFYHNNKNTPNPDAVLFSRIVNNLDTELKSIDINEDFLMMLRNPEYGYGSNINPCIDCKILMLKKAKEIMPNTGAAFVVTGEVLGQRPMSQHKQALMLIEKNADLEGLVLRPLSAKLLPETLPEKNSWVSREKLLGFNGRTRKPQIELAEKFGLKEYSQPAGGCLLTVPEFAKRLQDLINHQELNLDNVELLKLGRHFRISYKAKLVVGRDEKENVRLMDLAKENDYLFMPTDEMAGPTSLGRGIFDEDLIKLSCSITCRYCDLDGRTETEIVYRRVPEQEDKVFNVSVIEKDKLSRLRI